MSLVLLLTIFNTHLIFLNPNKFGLLIVWKMSISKHLFYFVICTILFLLLFCLLNFGKICTDRLALVSNMTKFFLSQFLPILWYFCALKFQVKISAMLSSKIRSCYSIDIILSLILKNSDQKISIGKTFDFACKKKLLKVF